MKSWEEEARYILPELTDTVTEADGSVMHFFFDVGIAWEQAMRDRHEDFLRRISMFTDWCLQHSDRSVSNAAGVGFVEHVFDSRDLREAAAQWVSRRMIEHCTCLWEARLTSSDLDRLRPLLERA